MWSEVALGVLCASRRACACGIGCALCLMLRTAYVERAVMAIVKVQHKRGSQDLMGPDLPLNHPSLITTP